MNYADYAFGILIDELKQAGLYEDTAILIFGDHNSLGTNIFASKDFVCLNNGRIIAQDYYYDEDWYDIATGEKVDLDNITQEEKEKLEQYYNYMKKELDISFSVNINDLLK